jgi:hypothetical protein
MNPYHTYVSNKPVNPLKRYREMLGLLTTKLTNKLSNTANLRKPTNTINNIIKTINSTTHKIWLECCQANTYVPKDNLGVGV